MKKLIAASYKSHFIARVLFVLVISGLAHAGDKTAGQTIDDSRSGVLFDELAHMDELIFTASFIACDPQKINALMTEDIEFYHDLTGFSSGQGVRDNNLNLSKNCPAKRGISRRLVEGSLRVYPIKDYGAIQMGTHVFAEKNSSRSTVAQFVHLWQRQTGKQKTEEKWKISRVLSFDHVELEPAMDEPLEPKVKKQER